MAERALLATREGSLTPGFERIVSASSEVVESLVRDRPADNRYHLPPGLVESLSERIEQDDITRVAVDGIAHEGQMVDLTSALPDVTVRDRRGVVWERLSEGGNPVAAARLTLRDNRIDRRRARRRRRDQQTTAPAGEDGAVAEAERACDRAAERLTQRQETQRRQISESYTGVDAYVTVLSSVPESADCWAGLTGEAESTGPLRPATPTTATTTVGPHELAVTDTPGLFAGGPEWLRTATPGTMAAVERADVVLTVGDVGGLPGQSDFDGTRLRVPSRGFDDPPEELRARLRSVLPTSELAVRLPYTDDGQAVLSWLYDRTSVRELEYGEDIYVRVECPETATESVERRVQQVGGSSVRP
ncbi:hypothetical protein GRX03_05955 [Halovenus sp. WSH3]|uniref:GTPase HflX n=1 Tax=Halovenus carboxidivorans TaxID=2692199 RepID=A0A6B0T8H5_9EURY|nr:hypothetical protein [Halovenus carboxidivorans]MXR51150.1 hypothetical protein [Halovenus carboxidivorans]